MFGDFTVKCNLRPVKKFRLEHMPCQGVSIVKCEVLRCQGICK